MKRESGQNFTCSVSGCTMASKKLRLVGLAWPPSVCSDRTWPPCGVVSLPNWPQMAAEGLLACLLQPSTSLRLFIWSQSDTRTHSDRQTAAHADTRAKGTHSRRKIFFFFCGWKQEHPDTFHLPALSVRQVHKASERESAKNRKSRLIKAVRGSLQGRVSANSRGRCYRL